jgi:hypothetical protein
MQPQAVKVASYNFKPVPVFPASMSRVHRTVCVANANCIAIARMDSKTTGHVLMARGQPTV